jgi:large subunit ribosomal protein L25
MAEAFKIEGHLREEFGKNAARRLRRLGRVPAVIYGADGPPLSIAFDPRPVARFIHSEAAHTAVLTMELPGTEPARVMLREWQTDPVQGKLLHVDFVRVARDTRVKVRVPIHVTGEPEGVKVQGGIFEFVLREVEVECLPDDIPEHITVDISGLTIGRNLRVAHLPVGENVKVLTDADRVVAHVVALKAEEEKAAAEGAEAAPEEPELIRKVKAEEEAEGEPSEAAKEKEKK